jgi:hypothetical protein
MQVRFSRLSLLGLGIAVLMSAHAALAQSSDSAIPAAITGVLILCFIIFGLAVYVYMALALQTIAIKTNTENPWLAWIPIANLILMLNVAKKPMWWIILIFHSHREYCHVDPGLDGCRRSSWQTQLVGHSDDRPIRGSDRPRLSCMGGLMSIG